IVDEAAQECRGEEVSLARANQSLRLTSQAMHERGRESLRLGAPGLEADEPTLDVLRHHRRGRGHRAYIEELRLENPLKIVVIDDQEGGNAGGLEALGERARRALIVEKDRVVIVRQLDVVFIAN